MNIKAEYKIGGQSHVRIRYGEEKYDWGAERQPCSSCAVSSGEFHHTGCFVERCPTCGGQAMTCRCAYEESFTRHPMSKARRRFYKVFYVTIIPALLAAAALWLVPIQLSAAVRLAIIGVISIITTCVFWSMLGEMELNQIFVTPKDTAS